MKSLKQMVVMGVFGVLACAGLNAQAVNVRATIPFDFTVGRASMPAGEYEISGEGTLVALRKLEGKPANAFVLTNSTGAAEPKPVGRLEFHRYGEKYFLASIWEPFSRGGRQLPTTPGEKEVAKRLGTSVEAMVIATKR